MIFGNLSPIWRLGDMSEQALEGLPLVPFGFVHVTGLSIVSTSGYSSAVLASEEQCGYYSIQGIGTMFIVTTKGEIWLALHNRQTEAVLVSPEFREIRDHLCPKGQGEWFLRAKEGYCIGGMQTVEIFHRISNPEWKDHVGQHWPLVRTSSWRYGQQ